MNDQASRVVDLLMKTALVRQTKDNLSAIFIGLENLKSLLYKHTYKTHSQRLEETKMLEKTRKKVEELKNENIGYKKDEELKYIDVLNQANLNSGKKKKLPLMKQTSIKLLQNLILQKQKEKERSKDRKNKHLFNTVKQDKNELNKHSGFIGSK